MDSGGTTVDRIRAILAALPGVVAVACLDAAQRARVVELESRHEGSSVLPVKNVGVRLLSRRNTCFAILKDGRFRPPRMPTVFLVEEGAGEGVRHVIEIEGTRYAVVGEEVMDGAPPYAEPTIPLDTSFVIFPDRRTGPQVPCSFLLPPIPFPELEKLSAELRIGEILSISPSLAADTFIRESFGFPHTNALATLLIGCTTEEGFTGRT